jgi:hypothetical protein
VSKYLLDTSPSPPNNVHTKRFGWALQSALQLPCPMLHEQKDPGLGADKLHLKGRYRCVRAGKSAILCDVKNTASEKPV